MKRQIIMFCGLPLAGKSVLSKRLANYLKLPLVDVDKIRHDFFQHPLERTNREKDRFQMMISYRTLYLMTDYLVRFINSSIVVSAPFSSEITHRRIIEVSKKNKVPLKIIYCHAPDKVIKKRAIQRSIKKDSFSTTTTWEIYESVRKRYQTIPLPKLIVDTSQPIRESLEKIIKFISKQ